MFRNKNKTFDRTYVSEARKLEEIIMADFFFQREEVEGHDDLICELQGS